MTKVNKTIIKDKILDLREKIQKQSMDLHEQVKKKKDRYHDIFEESNDKSDTNPISAMSGLLALSKVVDAIRKGKALHQLKESLEAQNLLRNKDNLVDKLYHHVNERLDIIEKAETKDLKDFLKDNDVYSVFEDGKLEKFLDNDKNDKSEDNLSSKENDKKKYIDKEVSYDR